MSGVEEWNQAAQDALELLLQYEEGEALSMVEEWNQAAQDALEEGE